MNAVRLHPASPAKQQDLHQRDHAEDRRDPEATPWVLGRRDTADVDAKKSGQKPEWHTKSAATTHKTAMRTSIWSVRRLLSSSSVTAARCSRGVEVQIHSTQEQHHPGTHLQTSRPGAFLRQRLDDQRVKPTAVEPPCRAGHRLVTHVYPQHTITGLPLPDFVPSECTAASVPLKPTRTPSNPRPASPLPRLVSVRVRQT